MRIHALLVSLLLIAVGLSGLDLHAQTRRSRPVERVEYEDVRDSLFPEFFTGRGPDGYGIGLRYMPCKGNELELTMIETSEEETKVLLYTPVKDSLREQFNAYMKRHPNARYEQVYPAMKVKKQVLAFSTAEIRSFRQEILDVMERSIRIEKDIWPVPGRLHTLHIHSPCVGDVYTIWFQGVSDLTLSRGYNEYAPDAPFITWMKEKRPTFEKWAATAPPK